MIRFSILPRAIVALNATRSTDGTRPKLIGVHLAPDGTMTSTDGRCLLTWRAAATYNDGDGETAAECIANMDANTCPPDGLILEITPAVLKLAKTRKCERLSVTIDGARATWNAETAAGFSDEFAATLARVIDGPYPNYRNVIPRDLPEIAGAMPTLNAEYLGRFALATGHVNNGITLTPTGAGRCVVVTFANNADALGLLMPTTDTATHAMPAWVHPTPADAQEAAA